MSANLSSPLAGISLQQETPADLVEVGKIATAHGVRGWLKIQAYSNTPEALKKSPIWWLQAPNPVGSGAVCVTAVKIKSCQSHGESILLANIQGLTDRDLALALRAYTVWLPRSDFPQAQSGEYYWVDLIGCKFYGLAGDQPVLLGQVDSVQENSAHAILTIALGDFDGDVFTPRLDNKNRPIYTMVPFVQAHVHDIDLQTGQIHSNWPHDF